MGNLQSQSMPTFTLEAWVKPTNVASTWGGIVELFNGTSYEHLCRFYSTSGKPNFYTVGGGGDMTSNTVLSNNIWYHIACVYDGAQKIIYINGVRDTAQTVSVSAQTIDGFEIGRNEKNNSYMYNGLIDDARIYNYARTPDQILQDYNAGASARLGAQSTGIADPWAGALPVAWWKLDENTGVKAYDASGNNNDGTMTGATWTQGKNGPCLSFNGTSDYVSASLSSVPNVFAIEAWIYPTESGREQHFAEFTNTQFYVGSNNKLGTAAWSNVAGSTTLSMNTWYHAACVRDGSEVKLYLNGKLDGSGGSLGTNPASPFVMGDLYTHTGSYKFHGKIDDVRIYNYARTPAQIAWDYNGGKPVGHWRMDEATSGSAVGTNNIKDDSGNGNQGSGSGSNIAWTTGKFGGALSFNGTNDYVSVNNNSSLNNMANATIEVWVKFNNLNSNQIPITKDGDSGYYIQINSDGRPYLRYGTAAGYIGSAGTITTGTWTHLAMVFSSGTLNLYKNGVALSGSVSGTSPSGQDDKLWIGAYSGNGGAVPTGYWVNGLIDDVRVYNYARTPEQIQQDYNNGASARLGN